MAGSYGAYRAFSGGGGGYSAPQQQPQQQQQQMTTPANTQQLETVQAPQGTQQGYQLTPQSMFNQGSFYNQFMPNQMWQNPYAGGFFGSPFQQFGGYNPFGGGFGMGYGNFNPGYGRLPTFYQMPGNTTLTQNGLQDLQSQIGSLSQQFNRFNPYMYGGGYGGG